MFRTVQKQAKRIFLKNLHSQSPTLKIKMDVDSVIPTQTLVAQNLKTLEQTSFTSDCVAGTAFLDVHGQLKESVYCQLCPFSYVRQQHRLGRGLISIASLFLSPRQRVSWKLSHRPCVAGSTSASTSVGREGGRAPGHQQRGSWPMVWSRMREPNAKLKPEGRAGAGWHLGPEAQPLPVGSSPHCGAKCLGKSGHDGGVPSSLRRTGK